MAAPTEEVPAPKPVGQIKSGIVKTCLSGKSDDDDEELSRHLFGKSDEKK